MTIDVVVLGAGPAGLAAAAACVQRGLAVQVVAPTPEAPWTPTYGAWMDDTAGAADLIGPAPWRASWDAVDVVGSRPVRLRRRYGLLDNEAVRAHLLSVLEAGRADLVDARVAPGGLASGGTGVRLATGATLAAGVVVDASGHEPVLVRRAERPRPAFQAAFGVVARCSAPPLAPGSCVLMDWTGGPSDDPDPTFLYGMDLGEGRWFLEETSLARRPALDEAVLVARLEERLAGRGVALEEVLATERVRIPMGLAVPPGDQPVVGFGGAASLVHPATGYSVATSVRLAPLLADALHDGLSRGERGAAAAARAWQAIWPPERRRVRALEHYGLEALLRFDRAAMQGFFDAFFSLPRPRWEGYLAGSLAPGEMAGAMREVFVAAPRRVQRLLATGNPRWLVRALLGAG